jgi:hypothetical protein
MKELLFGYCLISQGCAADLMGYIWKGGSDGESTLEFIDGASAWNGAGACELRPAPSVVAYPANTSSGGAGCSSSAPSFSQNSRRDSAGNASSINGFNLCNPQAIGGIAKEIRSDYGCVHLLTSPSRPL